MRWDFLNRLALFLISTFVCVVFAHDAPLPLSGNQLGALYGNFYDRAPYGKHCVNSSKRFSFDLGQSKVSIDLICQTIPTHSHYGPLFIALHSNEKTAVASGKEYVHTQGGVFIVLNNGDRRRIHFKYTGFSFSIDPNRMFTTHGISRDLKVHSEDKDAHRLREEVIDVVFKFGQSIVHFFNLKHAPLIISLHNNTNGGFSVHSFKDDFPETHIYYKPSSDPDNFFYVTNALDFDSLSDGEYSTVLEPSDAALDDGSLSFFFKTLEGSSDLNPRYINIEAQHGHKRTQLGMLHFLFDAHSIAVAEPSTKHASETPAALHESPVSRASIVPKESPTPIATNPPPKFDIVALPNQNTKSKDDIASLSRSEVAETSSDAKPRVNSDTISSSDKTFSAKTSAPKASEASPANAEKDQREDTYSKAVDKTPIAVVSKPKEPDLTERIKDNSGCRSHSTGYFFWITIGLWAITKKRKHHLLK